MHDRDDICRILKFLLLESEKLMISVVLEIFFVTPWLMSVAVNNTIQSHRLT